MLDALSRTLLKALLERTADGVLIADVNGKLTHRNPAAIRIWAGSAPADSMAEWSRYKGFHPDGRPFAPEDWGLATCLRRGEPVPPRDIHIERFDGTRGILSAESWPIRDEQGTLVGALSLFSDVTEARRNEHERGFMLDAGEILAASLDDEATLEDLAELVVLRLADWCSIDMRSAAGGVERVAVAWSAREPHDLATRLADETLAHPDERRAVQQVIDTGEPLHLPVISKDELARGLSDPSRRELVEQLAPHSVVIAPLTAHGRVLGAMTLLQTSSRRTFTDADARFIVDLASRAAVHVDNARLFHQARLERETLATLVKTGATIAAEIDVDRLVQNITDAAVRLSGAAFGAFFYNVPDDAGDRYLLWGISGAPREAFERFPRPRITEVFEPTFAGRGVVRSDDITQDPRYGRNAPLRGMPEGHLPVRSYLAVPVVSRSGEVIGGLLLGHSQPGRFDERHEQLVTGLAPQAATAMDNARLFREARSLILDLERTNRDLDQFAYVASHDLKAPLRGIANLAQWLEEDAGPTLSAEGREQLRLLRGRVIRLDGLIHAILEYSRAGRSRVAAEPVELSRLFQETADILSTRTVRWPEDLPPLTAERAPLQQVLLNLVGNAVKHARRDDAQVTLGCVEKGAMVEFSVSDNGPGIDPRFHQRIFEMFQTLESRDVTESTGIGLAIVRKLVDARGGKVWVESTPGHGATFRFTWPRSPTP